MLFGVLPAGTSCEYQFIARKALIMRMLLAISWDPWGNDDEIESNDLKIKSYLEKSYYVSLKRGKFKMLEKNKVSLSIKFDGRGRVAR